MDVAERCLQNALALERKIGVDIRVTVVLSSLAQLYRATRRINLAVDTNRESLRIARAGGNEQMCCIALLNLAMIFIEQDCAEEALVSLKAISKLPVAQSPFICLSFFDACCGLACLLGEWGMALNLYSSAQALAISTGIRREHVDQEFLNSALAKLRLQVGSQAVDLASNDSHQRVGAYAELLAWIDECEKVVKIAAVANRIASFKAGG
jgi:hypothetical protein